MVRANTATIKPLLAPIKKDRMTQRVKAITSGYGAIRAAIIRYAVSIYPQDFDVDDIIRDCPELRKIGRRSLMYNLAQMSPSILKKTKIGLQGRTNSKLPRYKSL